MIFPKLHMSGKAKAKTARRSSGQHPSRVNALRDQPTVLTGGERLPWILCFLLAVVTIALYSPVGRHPFIAYDDETYVTRNAHVQAGLTWETLKWAVTATEASNWHPLTWLSHALDCERWGLNPAGHHWTNVAIHALNVVLLFLLLWRMTAGLWRSALVAALFAVHPLNVESVAWVAERKNVLSTLFFLLALASYVWYVRKPNVRRYLVLVVLFILGLAAKPMVITLPFVLLLLDYWPLGRIETWGAPSQTLPVPQSRLSQLVVEKLPLLALSVASAAITLVAQRESVIPTQALPIDVRLETSVCAYGTYLWKAIWPARLALIYPHPGRNLPLWHLLLSAFVIVAVLGIAWIQRRTRPYLAVGWLWYLGTAVPVIGIVQVGLQASADRYAYVPLIGVFIAAVWEASALLDRMRLGVALRALAASLVLAAFAFTAWRQIGYWHSTAELWTHALEVTENNSVAERALASWLFASGNYQDGIVHLRNYARLEPLDPSANARVAADYQDRGQLREAVQQYEVALRASAALSAIGQEGLTADILAMTYANLGLVYAQMGEDAKAQASMRKALDTDAGTVGKMVSTMEQYLRQRPSAQGYLRLGILLAETGHGRESQQSFAQAQHLDPSLRLPQLAEVIQH